MSGPHEWLGVASLGLIGVPHEAALAFTILLHASWYVPTTLAGGLALSVRGVQRLRRSRAERATGRRTRPQATLPDEMTDSSREAGERTLLGRETWLAALGGVVLAIAMTWPLGLHLGSDIGKDLGDPLLQAWQVAWIGHALLETRSISGRRTPSRERRHAGVLRRTRRLRTGRTRRPGEPARGPRRLQPPVPRCLRARLPRRVPARTGARGRSARCRRSRGRVRLRALEAVAERSLHVLSSGGIPLALFLLLRAIDCGVVGSCSAAGSSPPGR